MPLSLRILVCKIQTMILTSCWETGRSYIKCLILSRCLTKNSCYYHHHHYQYYLENQQLLEDDHHSHYVVNMTNVTMLTFDNIPWGSSGRVVTPNPFTKPLKSTISYPSGSAGCQTTIVLMEFHLFKNCSWDQSPPQEGICCFVSPNLYFISLPLCLHINLVCTMIYSPPILPAFVTHLNHSFLPIPHSAYTQNQPSYLDGSTQCIRLIFWSVLAIQSREVMHLIVH